MRNTTAKMLFLTLGLVLAVSVSAQQWSSDPVVDLLKQSESEILKARAFLDWCKLPDNSHLDECSGINADEALRTKYLSWDEAMKQANEKTAPHKQTSLGDAAREFRIEKLQNKLEPIVATFCKNNPGNTACSAASPEVIAHLLAAKCDGFEQNLIRTRQKQK